MQVPASKIRAPAGRMLRYIREALQSESEESEKEYYTKGTEFEILQGLTPSLPILSAERWQLPQLLFLLIRRSLQCLDMIP